MQKEYSKVININIEMVSLLIVIEAYLVVHAYATCQLHETMNICSMDAMKE